jgi:hypothetical protein
MNDRTIRAPRVHLNGTSSIELLDCLMYAAEAVDAAYCKLKQCAPNGRDYYLDGPDAMREAQEQHEDRLRRLNSVYQELQALQEAVIDNKVEANVRK